MSPGALRCGSQSRGTADPWYTKAEARLVARHVFPTPSFRLTTAITGMAAAFHVAPSHPSAIAPLHHSTRPLTHAIVSGANSRQLFRRTSTETVRQSW